MATVTKRKWTYNGQAKEAWQVRYVDAGGKRRGKTFDRKKDADSYRVKVEGEIASGLHVAASPRTVSEIANEWLERQEGRFSRGAIALATIQNKRLYSGALIECMGARKAQDVDWQTAEGFIDWLRARPSRNGGKIGARYVNDAATMASEIFQYAEKRAYIARNPFPTAIKEAGRDKARDITPFTKAEIARLLSAIEQRGKGRRRVTALLRALVYLSAFCGLRKGESLALTDKAIDFDRGVIRITQGWTAPDTIGKPKTPHAVREVPLPPVVADALRAWEPFKVKNPRGLIFRTATGRQPFNGDFYTGAWGRALERADIAPDDNGQRNFHALRHFAGSAWLDLGVPLPTVSKLLGHANPAITARIYAHVIDNPMASAPVLASVAANLLATSSPANDARVTQHLLSA